MSNATQTFRGKASPDLSGIEFLKKFIGTTTPGSEVTIISYTVPANTQVNLLQLNITCNTSGVFKVFLDSDQVGSGRTGAAAKNVLFTWPPFKKVDAAVVVAVKYESEAHTPATEIEAYLQGREIAL